MEFYVVYIQEAHPSDLWQTDSNVKEGIIFKNPQGFEERVNVAGMCTVKLGLHLPALVDTMGNPTELAYTGWPDRLYVIDRDGKIAHKSDAGPYGFKPAKVRETLQRLFSAQQSETVEPCPKWADLQGAPHVLGMIAGRVASRGRILL